MWGAGRIDVVTVLVNGITDCGDKCDAAVIRLTHIVLYMDGGVQTAVYTDGGDKCHM